MLDDVRSALNTGLALDSEYFRDQVEISYGPQVKPTRMGGQTIKLYLNLLLLMFGCYRNFP